MSAVTRDAALVDRGCNALTVLGSPAPEQALRRLRSHLNAHGVPPLPAMQQLMRHHRLLCLGEVHDFAGRFMAAEMVAAAAQGGARTLFVEVYDSEQPKLDRFAVDGDHEWLPVSAGGGRARPYRFQQPYVQMLQAARGCGMRIVAIDSQGADYDERNVQMTTAVLRYLQQHDQRAVAIVGQLHLMRRQILGQAPSMATRLRAALGASIVTIGRAVPDALPEFSVWADVAGVAEPRLLCTDGSPFADLPSTFGTETLMGSDFDHLLFYPAAAVLEQRG
jgi:hypothetical protein